MHAHRHLPADFFARTHTEFIVLDIGADTGALLVYADAELYGTEIEVSPVLAPNQRTHTAVLRRIVNGQTVHTAVFAELSPGAYILWHPSQPETITISEGGVTERDWRTTLAA